MVHSSSLGRLAGLASLACMLVLPACSGSSGSSGSESRAPVALSPANGEQLAEPEATVVARFETSLKADTVDTESFQLQRDGTPVAGSAAYTSSTKEVSFTPSESLDFLTRYEATLRANILTADGSPIVPKQWAFRTRDGVWRPYDTLPAGRAYAEKRYFGNAVGMPDGSAWVTWEESHSNSSSVWVSRYRPGAGWSTPAGLYVTGDRLRQGLHAPRIAFNASGHGIAVWTTFRSPYDTEGTLQASHWDGVKWSGAESIGISGTNLADDPQVVMQPDGSSLVIWAEGSAPDSHVWSQRYVPDQGWTAPVQLGAGNLLSLSLLGDGQALALWKDNGTIQAAQAPIAGDWSAPTVIAHPAGTVHNPKLANSSKGNSAFVWTDAVSDNCDCAFELSVWSTQRGADGTWSTPQLIEEVRDWPEPTDLAAGPDGDFYFAYSHHHEVADWLRLRHLSRDAGPWGGAFDIPVPKGGFLGVKISIDSEGRGNLIWGAYNYNDGDQLSQAWNSRLLERGSQAWSTPSKVAEDQDRFLQDLIALPHGRAMMIWNTEHLETGVLRSALFD
ncbi:Ig-like domain-containing protein [Ideonella sp. DXS29W]|uniref:Ig-like domain-containing protein n=1 Tax=Ideonella lacteola TaxID=2984193 RepID=A0ABU9BQL5_9BURK